MLGDGMLPAERLAAVRAGVAATTAELVALAERYYDSAALACAAIPLRSRAAIATAGILYREIGRLLARRRHRVWNGRTIVSAQRKASLIGTSLGTAFAPAAWPQPHDASLHRHFGGFPGIDAREAV